MSDSEAWTVGRLLNWTASYLAPQSSSPRLDAEVLLAAARNCERIELYTAFDQQPSEQVLATFRELVRRRAQGEPVAYLVGQREFYSLTFRVTPDVLIPRPETEDLIVALLDEVQRREKSEPLSIADVGTGSGIIAICAAKRIPHCHVTAIDISQAALAVARANAEQHAVDEQMDFVESDLLAQLPDARFDLIVSNPPYVSEAEFGELPREVADYEPRGALLAGRTGTEVIERLVAEAATRLKPAGALIVEISPMIESRVREQFAAQGGYDLLSTVKDLAGRPRVVIARRDDDDNQAGGS